LTSQGCGVEDEDRFAEDAVESACSCWLLASELLPVKLETSVPLKDSLKLNAGEGGVVLDLDTPIVASSPRSSKTRKLLSTGLSET